MDRKEILRLGNLIKFEEYEFRHPDCEGMSFGKREGAINYLKLNTEEEIQKELKRVKEIDTRITMGELLDKLNELEGEVWNDHISLITFGPEPWGYKDRFPWFYNHMASLNVTPSQPLTSGAIFFICKGGNMQWLTNPIGSGYYFLRFYHNKSNWPERNCLVEVSRLGNYSYVDQVPEYKEYKEEDIEENEFKTKEAPAGSLWYGPLKAPEFTEKEKKLKAAAQDKIYWKNPR